MIAIVDYGVGNLHSILGAFRAIGRDARVTGDKNVILSAERVVLPGVGAFGAAMDRLNAAGLAETVRECAKNGAPLLGVCLGMQLLFEKSYEYGERAGLSLLPGEVLPMRPALSGRVKVPHMGWNALAVVKECALTKNLREGDCVYYVHSYYAAHCEDSLCAGSEYGALFVPGLVAKDNVFGCQFHPEKSGSVGLDILKAFSEVE